MATLGGGVSQDDETHPFTIPNESEELVRTPRRPPEESKTESKAFVPSAEEEEEAEEDVAALYSTLVYSQRVVANARYKPPPVQLVLPSKSAGPAKGTVCLGFPAQTERKQVRSEQGQGNKWVVFSAPNGHLEAQRTRINCILLLVLFPASFALDIFIFLQGLGSSQELLGTYLAGQGRNATITLAYTFAAAIVGIIAITKRSTRFMSIFISLVYADAVMNLAIALTPYQFFTDWAGNTLHVSHTILQFTMCFIMAQIKLSSLSSWFVDHVRLDEDEHPQLRR